MAFDSALHIFILLVGSATVLAAIRFYRSDISLAKVRGPKSPSFAVGNLLEQNCADAGEADLKWFEQYGAVLRYKATFGQDRLLVADPKALQHVHGSPSFATEAPTRELIKLVVGKGVIWAEGDTHKRQRKIILPAFGPNQVRELLPHFRHLAQKLTAKWQDLVMDEQKNAAVIDVHVWLAQATLDSLGEGAFDYHFDVLEGKENELAKLYHNFFINMMGLQDVQSIVTEGIMQFLPLSLIRLFGYLPTERMNRGRAVKVTAENVAKELIESKNEALRTGANLNRDFMSILLKANATASASARLSEEELIAQLGTFMIAGHETTTNALSWSLYELARNPDVQTRLRDEIKATQSAVGGELSAEDMAVMPYLQAVLKECLRMYPSVPHALKESEKDDILPLAIPITLTTGETVTEIPIPKGTKIMTSLVGYNRLKVIWGPDADLFIPERWLDGKRELSLPSFGMYANLATFGTGFRSCIGWRFALLEIQTFIVEIIGQFSLSLPSGGRRVRSAACGMFVPMLEGDRDVKLPLMVTLAD